MTDRAHLPLSEPMAVGFAHAPPPQWLDFARRHRPLALAAPALDALTPLRWEVVEQIHAWVRSFPYQSDRTRDVWTAWDNPANAPEFDCDDQACTMMLHLMHAGVPLGALRLARCRRQGIGHMVLVWVTAAGDYVLDGNAPVVAPWRSFDYFWVDRWDRPDRWVALRNPQLDALLAEGAAG